MVYPLYKDLPDEVRKNIELWAQEIWLERCDLIAVREEGEYSHHIFFLIQDLLEEIELNSNHFFNDTYAKEFFKFYLSKYSSRNKKLSGSKISAVKERWSENIAVELSLIIDVLSSNVKSIKFNSSETQKILKKINDLISSPDNFEKTLSLLLEKFLNPSSYIANDDEIVFLTDTLILFFTKKGTLAPEIKNFGNIITESLDKVSINNKCYPSFSYAPKQNDLTDEEYKKQLSIFYDQLTIQDRFYQLRNLFSIEPREYEVIFRVTGLQLRNNGFDIANARIYDPNKEKHIKGAIGHIMQFPYKDVERTDIPGIAISIKYKGVDSASVSYQARQLAERALAFLSKREIRQVPFKISKGFALCDSEGNVVAFTPEREEDDDYETIGDVWLRITDKFRKRAGIWISQEEKHETIQKLINALNGYRKSNEDNQGDNRLINSWFSIEQLIDQNYKISNRVPNFLTNRDGNGQDIWIHNDRIKILQCVLAITELKYELRKFASDIARRFTEVRFQVQYKYKISETLLLQFYNRAENSWDPRKFVELSSSIIEELKLNQHNIALTDVQELNAFFSTLPLVSPN